MTPAQAFGIAVQLLRTHQQMQRKQLLLKATISYPYLAEIENGMKEPTLQVARQLAEGLGVQLSQLLALAERIERGEVVLSIQVNEVIAP